MSDLPTKEAISQWRATINTAIEHGSGRVEIDGFEFRKYLTAASELLAIQERKGFPVTYQPTKGP